MERNTDIINCPNGMSFSLLVSARNGIIEAQKKGLSRQKFVPSMQDIINDYYAMKFINDTSIDSVATLVKFCDLTNQYLTIVNHIYQSAKLTPEASKTLAEIRVSTGKIYQKLQQEVNSTLAHIKAQEQIAKE